MHNGDFFEGNDIKIRPDKNGRIIIQFPNGEKVDRIKPKRLLTVSRPDTYIAMMGEDGQEIGILKDMNKLESNSKKHLLNSLERFYVVPHITEIHSLKEEYGISHWSVTTDRGRRDFDVQSRNTDIRVLPPRRVLIRDADNNRYEIPDYQQLSEKSRSFLDGEI